MGLERIIRCLTRPTIKTSPQFPAHLDDCDIRMVWNLHLGHLPFWYQWDADNRTSSGRLGINPLVCRTDIFWTICHLLFDRQYDTIHQYEGSSLPSKHPFLEVSSSSSTNLQGSLASVSGILFSIEFKSIIPMSAINTMFLNIVLLQRWIIG